MAQVLFDSPEIRREILRLKTFALSNTIDLSNGVPDDYKPVGDDPAHVVVNGNIRIVYSTERQPDEKLGLCHHLSVSKQGDGLPNPEIVSAVMEQFGMGNLRDSNPRMVNVEDGYAVNVLQPVS